MRRLFRPVYLLIAMVLFLQACGQKLESEEECNFVQNSLQQRVSWNAQLPVQLYIHSSVPPQYYGAIQSAMNQWDQSFGSRRMFEIAGVISQGTRAVQDGVSVIYWRSQWDGQRSNEQARTTIFWRSDQIQEADIQINDQDFSFSWSDPPTEGTVDIESLFLHELGHVLGLSHNRETGSVMATHLASASLRRKPVKTDIDSLRCEY